MLSLSDIYHIRSFPISRPKLLTEQKKSIRDLIEISASPTPEHKGKGGVKMTRQELAREIEKLEAQMRKAAHMMEYEYAAVLRDEIIRLRTEADKKS